MLDLLKWALQRHEKSKDTARKRLRVILVLDRVGLAPEQMEAMKRDIVGAVSKYLVVDEESVEMDMKRLDESLVLASNIQVKDIVRGPINLN
jgi:cell division topological specificity factor